MTSRRERTDSEEGGSAGELPTAQNQRAARNVAALSVAHLGKGMGRRTARGGIVGVIGQGMSMVIQLVGLMIMSRLLMPRDFGLMAIATAITGFATVFVDMGLSTAAIQKEKLDQQIASVLFFANLALGIAALVVVCAVSPLLAWIYNEPRVLSLIIVMSGVLPVTASGAQHLALLNRRFEFVTIRKVAILGQLCGLITSTTLASTTSAGYWALAAGAWVTAASGTGLAWYFSPWRPSIPTNWFYARSELQLGAHVAGSNIVVWAARQLDNLLVGAWWGASSLGVYSRAYSLFSLPFLIVNGPIRATIVPALSRLQDRPNEWRESVIKVCAALYLCMGAVTSMLVALSSLIISVVLGPKWHGVDAPFTILSTAVLFMTISSATGFIQISLGRSDRLLRWNLIRLPGVILCYFIGVQFGLNGMAAAVAVVPMLLMVPCIIYAVHGTNLRPWDILSLTPSALACVAVSVIVGRCLPDFGLRSPLLILLIDVPIVGLTYGTGALCILRFDPSYRSFRDWLMHQLRDALRGVRS